MSLRLRLFFTHTVVAVASLLVLSIALLLLLADYQQRLMVRELSFVATTVVRSLRVADATDRIDNLMERLAPIGQNQRFQIALLDSQGIVLQDSGFAAEASIVGHKLDLSHKLNAAGDLTASSSRDQIASGNYTDGQKRHWIYVAIALRPALAATSWMLIARPSLSGPVVSLQGESISLPFLEAGAVALVLAAVIAALVARSIAKPIQNVAAGANAIAQGKYDQRVVLSGPDEFKQLADDFNQMAARVQNAQTSERDFVANVSHELKTPLTSIKGFAQAIQDGAVNDPASIKNAGRIINGEAERLTRLVTGLLDSARLESGDIELVMQRLSINQVAQTCLERFGHRAEDAGINLVSNLADTPVIQADSDRLAQVVTNVLDNAFKHTRRGGKVIVESKPVAATRATPAGVELSVADTGEGIPADDLPRIFERFYQVDKARVQSTGNDAPGAGLGLAICKQIVEAHHGAITAQSVIGIGTRITVWLPLA